MVPTLYLFDRFDARLGILPAVGAVTHTEELGRRGRGRDLR